MPIRVRVAIPADQNAVLLYREDVVPLLAVSNKAMMKIDWGSFIVRVNTAFTKSPVLFQHDLLQFTVGHIRTIRS